MIDIDKLEHISSEEFGRNLDAITDRITGNCVRAYADMPKKGNHYRRIVDYWWIMY